MKPAHPSFIPCYYSILSNRHTTFASSLTDDILVDGMCVLPYRLHLAKDRELCVVVDFDELFDLARLTGLLLAKLVTREGEHAEEVAEREDVVQARQVPQVALRKAAH